MKWFWLLVSMAEMGYSIYWNWYAHPINEASSAWWLASAALAYAFYVNEKYSNK